MQKIDTIQIIFDNLHILCWLNMKKHQYYMYRIKFDKCPNDICQMSSGSSYVWSIFSTKMCFIQIFSWNDKKEKLYIALEFFTSIKADSYLWTFHFSIWTGSKWIHLPYSYTKTPDITFVMKISIIIGFWSIPLQRPFSTL